MKSLLRKIVLICLACIFLLSGCSIKIDNGTASKDSGSTTKNSSSPASANTSTSTAAVATTTGKVTLQPLDGWTVGTTITDEMPVEYINGASSFIVTVDPLPAGVSTLDDTVSYAKVNLPKALAGITFGDESDVTVSGMSGKKLVLTYSTAGVDMQQWVIYVVKSQTLYSIACSGFTDDSLGEKTFADLTPDFNTYLSNIKLS